jgi:hypothetical protein
MGDGGARPRGSQPRVGPSHTGPPRRANSTAIVLVSTKLRHPALRPGTIGRPRLMNLLAPGKLQPVVSVVAPPGFGKTTLLAQWAERGDLAFA